MLAECQTINGLICLQAITKFATMKDRFDFWNLGVEDLAKAG